LVEGGMFVGIVDEGGIFVGIVYEGGIFVGVVDEGGIFVSILFEGILGENGIFDVGKFGVVSCWIEFSDSAGCGGDVSVFTSVKFGVVKFDVVKFDKIVRFGDCLKFPLLKKFVGLTFNPFPIPFVVEDVL